MKGSQLDDAEMLLEAEQTGQKRIEADRFSVAASTFLGPKASNLRFDAYYSNIH